MMDQRDREYEFPELCVPALPPVEMIVLPVAEGGDGSALDEDAPSDRTDHTEDMTGVSSAGTPAPADASADRSPAEPAPMTQEMSAATAQAYAAQVPHPTGAAAAAHPPQIPLAPAKRMQARFNPLADGMVYLVVFVGGCLGTALRYGLSLLLPAPLAGDGFFSAFHTATFLANMFACFLFAGLTAYMSQAAWIRKRARQLTSRGAGMGFCGGFSTLSAMVIEELTAIQNGQIGGFLCYALVSFVGGLIVAAAGVKLALVVSARREARVIAEAVTARERDTAGAAGAGAAGGAGTGTAGGRADSDTFGSGFVQVARGNVPEGDYGQPQADSAADGSSPVAAASVLAADVTLMPAIEPEPVTDEIPLVADPLTGDAKKADEYEPGGRDAGHDTAGSGARS